MCIPLLMRISVVLIRLHFLPTTLYSSSAMHNYFVFCLAFSFWYDLFPYKGRMATVEYNLIGQPRLHTACHTPY